MAKTNEEIAYEVCEGRWGNGSERVRKLTEAGYDAKAVQAIVDKIMAERKNGTVKDDSTLTVEVDLKKVKQLVLKFKE